MDIVVIEVAADEMPLARRLHNEIVARSGKILSAVLRATCGWMGFRLGRVLAMPPRVKAAQAVL